ncbi:MAG: hypothetical protein ACE5G3_04960 [Gammaproteobacteria bacterium]
MSADANRAVLNGMLNSARGALAMLPGFGPRPLANHLKRLRPWRALGLVDIRAESCAGQQLRSITFLRTSIAGRATVSAVVACPDHALGCPIFSVDGMIVGSSLLFVLEVLDPGVRDDPPHRAFMSAMAGHKEKMLSGPVVDATVQPPAWNHWYIPDASIRVKVAAGSAEEILAIFEDCVDSYARLIGESLPFDTDTALRSGQQVEAYVSALLDEGGPAVETFRFLLGRHRQREFVRSVMFGLESPSFESG